MFFFCHSYSNHVQITYFIIRSTSPVFDFITISDLIGPCEIVPLSTLFYLTKDLFHDSKPCHVNQVSDSNRCKPISRFIIAGTLSLSDATIALDERCIKPERLKNKRPSDYSCEFDSTEANLISWKLPCFVKQLGAGILKYATSDDDSEANENLMDESIESRYESNKSSGKPSKPKNIRSTRKTTQKSKSKDSFCSFYSGKQLYNCEMLHPSNLGTEQLIAQRLVGRLLKVYWPLDSCWYEGMVCSYRPIDGKHQVFSKY